MKRILLGVVARPRLKRSAHSPDASPKATAMHTSGLMRMLHRRGLTSSTTYCVTGLIIERGDDFGYPDSPAFEPLCRRLAHGRHR